MSVSSRLVLESVSGASVDNIGGLRLPLDAVVLINPVAGVVDDQ